MMNFENLWYEYLSYYYNTYTCRFADIGYIFANRELMLALNQIVIGSKIIH